MQNKNKKGDITVSVIFLIVLIAGGLLAIFIFAPILAGASPAAAGFSCGLNMRIDAAVIENSRVLGKPVFDAPIFMCGQYKKPIDINANNFKACPSISDFCENAQKGSALQVECWKQCARIQIDKLTDSCWTMAGSGKLNFEDSWLDGFKDIVSNPYTLGAVIVTGGVGWYAGGALLGKLAVGSTFVIGGYYSGTGSKILRCYEYRIVNPIVSPIDKKPIKYLDNSLGRSWAYSLECSCDNCTNRTLCPSLMSTHLCRPTAEDPMCSFGGTGVSHINEMGELKYVINDKDIATPTDDVEYLTGAILNYNITDPKSQICYIAYHQSNEGPKIEYTDPEGSHSAKLNNKYVVRSCNSWSAYAGGDAHFMN